MNDAVLCAIRSSSLIRAPTLSDLTEGRQRVHAAQRRGRQRRRPAALTAISGRQRARAELGGPGSGEEWRHAAAESAAHGQACSALEHHFIVAMKQRLQLDDLFDVHDRGSMDAHELAGIQSSLDLLQRLPQKVASVLCQYLVVTF